MSVVYKFNTCIVGSGAAGLNCADTLYNMGQIDIAIITEGINMGTSRNTGSDKQTYYKLTMSGNIPDSVYDMAETLFNGGSMHGDLALVEAAASSRAFYKLVGLGVPFPYNEYGEYSGYKTDHDPRFRASSCGPLTSKYMTEQLEEAVKNKKIPIFDGYRVIKIFTENGKAVGLAALHEVDGLAIFKCTNVVYAVGGPSAIYSSTVYPESQTCAHGIAFLSGAEGVNLTESQYGLASVKFRWNLSGTYQQVIPRYISVPENGEPYEFINDYDSIFMKGYQWPFDPRKLNGGSSEIDLAVYKERLKGNRVYLDYASNPKDFDFGKLSTEAYIYLQNSGALFGNPVDRLLQMNAPAYELYKSHGIDLKYDLLEIDVCAQHNNGGFSGDIWYESTSLGNFFPIGEANGIFGVYRPGGSALNSTQVSSLRAAIKIVHSYRNAPTDFEAVNIPIMNCMNRSANIDIAQILEIRNKYGKRMSKNAAFIRDYDNIGMAVGACKADLDSFFEIYSVNSYKALIELSINYDILVTQYVYMSAIEEYIRHGGKSRGSYLINGDSSSDNEHTDKVCYVKYINGEVVYSWEKVRPIPSSEQWFETVYNSFMLTNGFGGTS